MFYQTNIKKSYGTMTQVKKENVASQPEVAWTPFLITQPLLLGINHHPDFYENPFLNFLIDVCLNLEYTESILLYMDSFAQCYSLRSKNIVASDYHLVCSFALLSVSTSILWI